MALLRGFGSRHIHSFLCPSFIVSTMTKLLIHGVASCTSAIISASTKHLIELLIELILYWWTGTGLHGKGFGGTLGSILIWYGFTWKCTDSFEVVFVLHFDLLKRCERLIRCSIPVGSLSLVSL